MRAQPDEFALHERRAAATGRSIFRSTHANSRRVLGKVPVTGKKRRSGKWEMAREIEGAARKHDVF